MEGELAEHGHVRPPLRGCGREGDDVRHRAVLHHVGAECGEPARVGGDRAEQRAQGACERDREPDRGGGDARDRPRDGPGPCAHSRGWAARWTSFNSQMALSQQ